MKKTKPKSQTVDIPRTKNRFTQTENTDESFIELVNLQQKLTLLEAEIDVLKKRAKIFDLHPKSNIAPQTSSKINSELSGCGCKGSCTSRHCGCVKKYIKCNRSCRCNDKICQNQKSRKNQEKNKENVNINDIETNLDNTDNTVLKTGKNNTKSQPVTMIASNKEVISDINVTSTSSQQAATLTMAEFNPMKPKHQLSRTPPNYKKIEKHERSESFQDSNNSPAFYESRSDLSLDVKDIEVEEEEINWEQHTAQLVPCKKCKRTFKPDRIQKHEACCKKI